MLVAQAAVWMAQSPERNNTASDQQKEDDLLIRHTDITKRAIYTNTLNTHH